MKWRNHRATPSVWSPNENSHRQLSMPNAMLHHDETTLIARLREGDETTFRTVVEMYQDRVYNTIVGIVRAPGDAEDLAQEVFVEVYLSIESFRQTARLSTWIYRIAVNKALGHLRAKKAKKRFGQVLSIFGLAPADEKPDWAHPAALLEQKEQSEQLARAIESLPEKQRAAFILRQSEDLSYAEIAETLGLSIPSVESLLFRAKQNLQKNLTARAAAPQVLAEKIT